MKSVQIQCPSCGRKIDEVKLIAEQKTLNCYYIKIGRDDKGTFVEEEFWDNEGEERVQGYYCPSCEAKIATDLKELEKFAVEPVELFHHVRTVFSRMKEW